jgi:hypothetical protein
MDDEEFRRGNVVTEAEVGDVEGAKRSVFRDGGVEKDRPPPAQPRTWRTMAPLAHFSLRTGL